MSESKVKDYRIHKAVNIVNAKFNQNLDFDNLAETLNLSPSRLRHLFKEETGMSFRQYLRLIRLRRAKRLLETTFLSIREIGELVGIHDSSHFVRDFEKEFGLSPSKYRKTRQSAKKKSISQIEMQKKIR